MCHLMNDRNLEYLLLHRLVRFPTRALQVYMFFLTCAAS